MVYLGGVGVAQADRASDVEILFNWAERAYAQYFPSHDATKAASPWLYRYYPQTGVYLGLNDNNGIYVLGGEFGSEPLYVNTLASLLTQANATACSTGEAPAGISYSQSGDTVNVSTNGKCVKPPVSGICNAPTPTQATGVSVLGNTTVSSFAMGGFNILLPGFPNPFESAGRGIANAKSCIRNAPAQGFSNLTINLDVCYDLTEQLGSLIQTIPGVVEVNPPITMTYKGQVVNQVVTDCFATDATTVVDALTNEVWVKQNGSFVKIK